MRLLRRLVDSRDPGSYANRLRERRFALFRSLLGQVQPPVRILDVGGTPTFWEMRGPDIPGNPSITILNLEPLTSANPEIATLVGDACDMSQVHDGAFDVVFSNAVIEHVETLENQHRMAAEIRRVGRRYFVQTPNKRFPLEPHFLVPGFQYLPLRARSWLLRRMSLGWYARTTDPAEADAKVRMVRLMTENEFRAVFPDATIHREKVFGLTKSFIAIGGWDQPV